jgi:hypothetical protein
MKKVTIEIKRPNGRIEILDVSDKFENGLTDGMFETIKKATKEAGRGDCLSYNVEVTLSEEDQALVDADNKWGRFLAKHTCSAR